jgi:kynurenine formamidase
VSVESKPSDEAHADQVGLVGRLGPANTLAALKLAGHGRIYDLDSVRWHGMPMAPGHPAFQLLSYRTTIGYRNQRDSAFINEKNEVGFGINSELMIATMHSGTHIDALNHVCCGPDAEWFGGSSAYRDLGDFGPMTCDSATIPPIVARGVLLDVARHLGASPLPKGYAISAADVEATAAAQGVTLLPDDVVLIRTGYMEVWADTEKADEFFGSGIDHSAALYLAAHGAVLVAGDNVGLEVIPSTDPANPHPVHIEFLIRRGIHIMELVDMEQLAADSVGTFCFISLPLRVHGTTGSMVRPIAIA